MPSWNDSTFCKIIDVFNSTFHFIEIAEFNLCFEPKYQLLMCVILVLLLLFYITESKQCYCMVLLISSYWRIDTKSFICIGNKHICIPRSFVVSITIGNSIKFNNRIQPVITIHTKNCKSLTKHKMSQFIYYCQTLGKQAIYSYCNYFHQVSRAILT